jgi:hypothetical protein
MAKNEEVTDVFKVLVETPGGDRPFGRSTQRCEGHTEIHIKERDVVQINQGQDRSLSSRLHSV